MTRFSDKIEIIAHAVAQRDRLQDSLEALRLFNGFYEGCRGLMLDRYGTSLVITDTKKPEEIRETLQHITDWAKTNLRWLNSILLKQRQHSDDAMKRGQIVEGTTLPDCIHEFGITYAIDLQINQDSSFYLDTRGLRQWLSENANGWRVLNTFAYTGSLGVAAGAGGAMKVVQTDLGGSFLELARRSWQLNNLPEENLEIIQGDFFRVTGRLRHQSQLFDCVILDPPFFSTTDAGKVDLQNEMTRLINKVRPLTAHEGWLVILNNALYFSGVDFMREIENLCQSPYLEFDRIIPVPQDVTGFPTTIRAQPPVDTSPFNHPTKIVLMKVYRKDKRR